MRPPRARLSPRAARRNHVSSRPDFTLCQAQRQVSLSVLTPVFNERHLVPASLARVLALESELISRLELIVVDDCSDDGSWEILQQIARADSRVQLYRHHRNCGKGAAIRTALEHATGDICIVHDADMEYNPADIPALLWPFIEEGADAVFGSRYMSAPYRRALMHRHTILNKSITSISNWLTDLNLSDVETCYKAVNTEPAQVSSSSIERLQVRNRADIQAGQASCANLRSADSVFAAVVRGRQKDPSARWVARTWRYAQTRLGRRYLQTGRIRLQDSGRPAACAPIQQMDGRHPASLCRRSSA